jgi:hypothetical protein
MNKTRLSLLYKFFIKYIFTFLLYKLWPAKQTTSWLISYNSTKQARLHLHSTILDNLAHHILSRPSRKRNQSDPMWLVGGGDGPYGIGMKADGREGSGFTWSRVCLLYDKLSSFVIRWLCVPAGPSVGRTVGAYSRGISFFTWWGNQIMLSFCSGLDYLQHNVHQPR